MDPEKTYLYKRARREPIDEEPRARRKTSKTASISESRRRSDHKHVYRKVILHYGSSAFCWGRQCEICGRIDSTYKASSWSRQDFKVTGAGLHGSWSDICLAEIHARYPEYKLMTLEKADWREWTTG